MQKKDHIAYDWSSNNDPLNCFFQISSGQQISFYCDQSNKSIPKCFPLIHLRFSSTVDSLRTNYFRSGQYPWYRPKFGYSYSFFLCMINFSHLQLCWKDVDNLNPLKSLARNDGRLNSQGKFMQQIPRCALCELHNQKPRYRGDSYHGHNWQRPKIELRFHHRSFWRCPYTLWP